MVQFWVHESVLRQSAWFQKCLDSGMCEQTTRIVNLPEDDPDVFEIIFKWLYGDKQIREENVLRIASTYITTDIYGLLDLQNALVDAIRELCATTRLGPSDAALIYRLSPDCCELRNFVVAKLHHDICKWPDDYGRQGVESGLYGREMRALQVEDTELAGLLYRKCKGNMLLLQPATYPTYI
ncbi:hypothetical protein G647_04391 [Cladophialophora carrionii CBS 160.54]|uniref:BTB domain-containing protein n=1 Tax=Cladophialophora carrionii CBS 160.54 TaxID=1279043 RepID=V9DEC2_9EURO|nr:uncharacterized protein G647_04391 [Cladophialophora carrionii CBS 160.54]ETI25021.1 hypothetical protein G647_04391 [Cladophialophora carrionii CBS 160.54]